MKTTRLISILALVAATTLVGCKNNQQSVDELTTENESLRKQLDDRNAALESADRERLAAILGQSEEPQRQPDEEDIEVLMLGRGMTRDQAIRFLRLIGKANPLRRNRR